MITFKEYLTEARMAPLYHGTDGERAQRIIVSNTLKMGPARDGYHGKQVSLTRNLPFALQWGTVVFELDQDKLSRTYPIKPYNFFGLGWSYGARSFPESKSFISKGKDYTFTNQFEEAISRDITNIDKYITKIIIPESHGKDAAAYFKEKRPVVGNHPLLYTISPDRKMRKVN